MAAEADVYIANIARTQVVSWGPINKVSCYNNFTHIDPRVSNASESIQNVVGCSVAAGPTLTYIDWISGKNMWFAGGDGIGLSSETAGEWNHLFNVNIGYYF
ncbi:hypothetical protein CAI21_06340 [Alkalilimnicola ehrlichii]|uniref:Uncharacterized protein n=1 Tax=Alkalilimnicola ehrlichii TaxID=351052 RepID=A0A3E0X0X0_9GAMM|nr:hypothetical protein [Alkalilimnicola ehrlichii]RFA30235.1 hypothetical protein CAI21_06340 [Alkalilimnicola ehrlichii]RFA37817.1 hypothetical protein CAL65_07695 [Alkalilimnicola ehrlichii]